VLTLLLALLPQITSASDSEPYTRLAGQTRYQTSQAVAENYNSGQTDNIVIATGTDFADALSVSVLAHQLNAPILLVDKTLFESQDAFDYISRHMPNGTGTIWIAGGPGAVSESFELKSISMGHKVKRIGERNRYETSLSIAKETNTLKGTPIFLATGENFPDALSIASVAASKGYPIILTPKDKLPDGVESYLSKQQSSEVFIVGGTGVISESVEFDIKTILPESSITRLAGRDRFETSTEVYKKFFPNPENIYIASAMDFPDALSASVLAAKNNAPIVLINPNKFFLPDSTYDYLYDLGTSKMIIIGGTSAVPDLLADSIEFILTFFLTPSYDVQSNNQEIINLAESITKGLPSDYDKVRAVHDWVAKNIAYDVEGLNNDVLVYDALGTLHARKSVCQGYADLSAALLRSVGIKTKIVHGIAAWGPIPEEIRKNPQAYSSNHAWNEAYADRRWVVFDATWDAGYVNYDITEFVFCFTTKYFDPDPEVFAIDHLKTSVDSR